MTRVTSCSRKLLDVLNSCVREADTVARLGGDEFAVILGELNDVDCRGERCSKHPAKTC